MTKFAIVKHGTTTWDFTGEGYLKYGDLNIATCRVVELGGPTKIQVEHLACESKLIGKQIGFLCALELAELVSTQRPKVDEITFDLGQQRVSDENGSRVAVERQNLLVKLGVPNAQVVQNPTWPNRAIVRGNWPKALWNLGLLPALRKQVATKL